MSPFKNIATLREETAHEAFLEQFGNDRPELTGAEIDSAFRKGIRCVVPSQRIELLEREMERILGIVSDEEE